MQNVLTVINLTDNEDRVDSKRGYYQLQQKSVPPPTKPAPNKRPTRLVNGKSSEVVLNAVPSTPLLDSSASKTKAHLANSGAMAARRPPSRKNSGVRCSLYHCMLRDFEWYSGSSSDGSKLMRGSELSHIE